MAEPYPVINSWQDVEKNLPAGKHLVGITLGEEQTAMANTIFQQDPTSLTGSSLTAPLHADHWSLQWTQETNTSLKKDLPHSVYILTKIKKGTNAGYLLRYAFFGEQSAWESYDAKDLKDQTWQLLKVADNLVPSKFEGAYLGETACPEVTLGGVLFVADYRPDPYMEYSVSPNNDKLNDTAEIRQVLKTSDVVAIDILDAQNKIIRHLMPATKADTCLLRTYWDGKDDAGNIPPEGSYSVRITINGEAKDYANAILLENLPPWKPIDYSNPHNGSRLNYFPLGVYLDDANCTSLPADTSDAAGTRKWYDRHFKTLAENGFNTVILVWAEPDRLPIILEEAKKHGIGIILLDIHSDEIRPGKKLTERRALEVATKSTQKIEKLADSVVGYYLADEPPQNLLKNWLTMQRVVYNVDPTRPSIICLNDASSIGRALQQAPLHNLCMDNYMIREKVTDMSYILDLHTQWVRNLAVMGQGKEEGKGGEGRGGRPAWTIIQAFGDGRGGFRDLTIEETRALTWTTLAGGAKGIIHFIYNPLKTTAFTTLTEKNGDPKPQLLELGRINNQIKPVLPMLNSSRMTDLGIGNIRDAELGQFLTQDGQPFFIIANRDAKNSREFTVYIPPQYQSGQLIDACSQEKIPQQGDYLRLTLPPGDGRILLLKKPQ